MFVENVLDAGLGQNIREGKSLIAHKRAQTAFKLVMESLAS